jgi:adenylyltransferase/sulfurtransferase
MDDSQLSRYSRHILLPQIDIAGQQRLLEARVLVIGLGGLGSPVAMYLAASGVGHLTLVDHDRVELTNLQRQIAHTAASIGEPKTLSAARELKALNPGVELTLIDHKLEDEALERAARAADIVVDTTDSFASRFAINAACVRAGRPLVSGAVVRFEGQVAVFAPGGPCYRCLYTETGGPDEPCSTFGVLAPAAGVIGSIQATETLKMLLGIGKPLTGRLLLMDALNMEWREMKLRRDPACPVCGAAGGKGLVVD